LQVRAGFADWLWSLSWQSPREGGVKIEQNAAYSR
jgi:hypothetical protein